MVVGEEALGRTGEVRLEDGVEHGVRLRELPVRDELLRLREGTVEVVLDLVGTQEEEGAREPGDRREKRGNLPRIAPRRTA